MLNAGVKCQIFDVLCSIGVVKREKRQFFELLFAIYFDGGRYEKGDFCDSG